MGQAPSQTLSPSVNYAQATSAYGLPNGPASFSTYQLPGTCNNISVNLAGLQSCMLSSSGSDLLNNCISNNISGLNNQSNSYQSIKYVGPGHTLDNTNNVTFGAMQNFQNVESNNAMSTNTVVIFTVIVIIYLFIMLKK